MNYRILVTDKFKRKTSIVVNGDTTNNMIKQAIKIAKSDRGFLNADWISIYPV